MSPKPEDVLYGLPQGTRAALSGFSEGTLVEKPAIDLLERLGWRHVDLYE